MSVKKGRLKHTVVFPGEIAFACLLFISGYLLFALNNIKESVAGFTLGFYQYDSLAQTSARLRLDDLTPEAKNAALVEQLAGIAKSMDQYAQQLADVVSFFTLDEQKNPQSVH